jgi:acetyl esterase/lipase
MMIRRLALVLAVTASLAAGAATGSRADRRVSQPPQPESGPGGKATVCASVRASRFGEAGLAYWLFEPADPAPASAPLIVFDHGWSGLDPNIYGAWIEHIVRRGNIVVYPEYQADLRTPPTDFTPNAIAAVRDAITQLQSGGHVRPLLDKFAVVGHSAGGTVTANIAAMAAESGLPAPLAVMCVAPGKTWNVARRIRIPLADMNQISASTLLLAVAGADDRIVKDIDARKIFEGSTRVPAANKDLVVVQSDDRGSPALAANHFAPCAMEMITGESAGKRRGAATGVDALDYYAYWKLFDALCDAAFYGKNREYALGNTPQQRFMGTWSDGTPVRELVVTDAP